MNPWLVALILLLVLLLVAWIIFRSNRPAADFGDFLGWVLFWWWYDDC